MDMIFFTAYSSVTNLKFIQLSHLQTCWRRTASPQEIDAQTSQGSVAPLPEGHDEAFSVMQFSSADS
jgi:hypothetical protein